jgi:hypothetical protein
MKKAGKGLYSALAIISLWTVIERASAGEIEPLKTALISMLGKVQVQHEGGDGMDYWKPKAGKGKAGRVVFIERNIYPPNCTHTWAVGIDAKTGRVVGVHPLEMGCPHGYPAKSKDFLSQFQGKGFSDIRTLDNIDTIAKATGTCKLAAGAVKKSLNEYQRVKGKL